MKNRSIASPQGPSPAELPVFSVAVAPRAEQPLHCRTLLNVSQEPVLPSDCPEGFF